MTTIAAAGATSSVMLVEPPCFYQNMVAAEDDKFMDTTVKLEKEEMDRRAKAELKAFYEQLCSHNVRVKMVKWSAELSRASDAPQEANDEALPDIPDSIFPNNSIGFSGVRETAGDAAILEAVLYPMSPGRRNELPPSLLTRLKNSRSVSLVDLREPLQSQGAYLEGTGAMNFSVDGTAVFVSLSLRASVPALISFLSKTKTGQRCKDVFVFTAELDGNPVYHTNVVGWNGTTVSAYALELLKFDDALVSTEERKIFQSECPGANLHTSKESFQKYFDQVGQQLILLSANEVRHFCGNAFEVVDAEGRRVLTLSTTAWEGLSDVNRQTLLQHYQSLSFVVRAAIPTIERVGGGSVRCLQAAFRSEDTEVSALWESLVA
jgi:hypothetical protein